MVFVAACVMTACCFGSDCTWGVIFSGPRLFLSCPMDIAGSQVWFTDLWNYSVVPYIIEAVRDGLQVGLGPDLTEPAVVPVCVSNVWKGKADV